MVYQSFSSPLPSPPADGHSLPFLPTKRLDSIRNAHALPLTPGHRQNSWFVSNADSDVDSEASDDSQEAGRRSSDSRLQSIPTIVLTPPQSPISQFLLSEEDIQSSLNANQRRERLFSFGTRLTGLGEKMGMMNLSNNAMDSPTRSRSVSPPPVSVAPPQKIQLQEPRPRSSKPNGSPISDVRRASTDSIRPLSYHSAAFDSLYSSSTPGSSNPVVNSPTAAKVRSILPRASRTRSSVPEDTFIMSSGKAIGKPIKRPTLVRADKSIDVQRVSRMDARFDSTPSQNLQDDWRAVDLNESNQENSWMASAGQNFRRNSNSGVLPAPVTTPEPAAFFDCVHGFATSDEKSKPQFRALSENAPSWTPAGATRRRFKPYLFLLVPLFLMLLHVYYSAVNQEFLRAGNALVFEKPNINNGIWSSRDLMLIDEHFDGLDHTPRQLHNDDSADASTWYSETFKMPHKDKETSTKGSHASSHRRITGQRIRWLRRGK